MLNVSATGKLSKLEKLQLQPDDVKKQFLDSLTPDQKLDFLYDLKVIGRPQQQIPEGSWATILALAGRGWGKTFMGAHTVNNWANDYPGCRIALIGETVADVRGTMIRGESGILNRAHPSNKPEYVPSNRIVKWSNGSIAETFSGDEPGQLRGPNFHFAWVDELAKMTYQDDVWDMLQFCMRLGDEPQVLITTTPRPTKLIKTLVNDDDTYVITGSMFDNKNLPKRFTDKMLKQYEGTRLGRQELYAIILDDNPSALFQRDDIDESRVSRLDFDLEILTQIVVAVDPAVTNKSTSDDTGIVVSGKDKEDNGYVLHDATMKASPATWASKAIKLYNDYGASYIVIEVNQGGDMCEQVIKNIDRNVRVKQVRATKGKALRAEPVASLYEQHRVHHVGTLTELEDEMCGFDPSASNQRSPGRLDAVVWGLTHLLVKHEPRVRLW